MTTPTKPQQNPHDWASDALLTKAQSYAQEMLSHTQDDWKFILWSTLTLELLGRAALSKFSPALLADSSNWNNLLYALGFDPRATKFSPRSIEISLVFTHLEELLSDFTPELSNFCTTHMSRRNEELHSGSTPLLSLSSSRWLPTYYRACSVLLASMGESFEVFLGPEETAAAIAMMEAANDESAKSITGTITTHKTVWMQKSELDKSESTSQSTA